MKRSIKRFLSLALTFLMVMTSVNVSVFAEGTDTPVSVSAYEELANALSAGSDVLLTADITVDTRFTVPDDVTIDLNGKTLYINVENSTYNNATITNGNIVIGKDDVHTCDGYFLVAEGKTLTVSGVTLTSSDAGYDGYTIFHLKEAADLVLTNSVIDVANNEYAGSIIYANNVNSDVSITSTSITGDNVGRGFVYGNITLTDSDVTLTATTEGGMEHGFNRSTLTVIDSDITISGGTGRGITAETGDITISGDSKVTITDMAEASIELRGNKNLVIADTADVRVDKAVNNTTSGTVDGTVSIITDAPELPTATVTDIENEALTFAMNFTADAASDEQLAYYGDWYADFVLTVNQDVTFNANGGADGYLSGQYDAWSENWVNVPFDDVTLAANEPLKVMEYAAAMMGQAGLKLTYNDVYTAVKDFDCGVFFEKAFLAGLKDDLKVTLELRMFNPADETESYAIGETYTFEYGVMPTATITELENEDLTFAMNFKADEVSEATLNTYKDWYADFVLTINQDVTFNANGGADGYLSGQYDAWSENWVNVPFDDVTLAANTSLKVMEYAAAMMGQAGLKLTYNDVYSFVKDFDCGVFFEKEFLAGLTEDLEVTLELRMFNPADETESYVIGETYTFEYGVAPTATVTEIEKDDLTFAMNFKADEVSDATLATYKDWFADFVLTVNKDVTFNANGGADGYLSGQYDAWSENWVNVPFEDVTLKAGESLKVMEYAAKLMGQPGLKQTYNDVYTFVKDFDCGVFFESDFLAANPDLEVTLELRMYNPEDETESYAVGDTYVFTLEQAEAVAQNVQTEVVYDDVMEALLAAEADQTVVLLKDVATDFVMVPADITFDLAGYTLTTGYFASYGDTVDASEANSGLLVVPATHILMQKNNSQFPVKNGNGYQFFEVLLFQSAVLEKNTKYAFQPKLEAASHELLKQGSAATGLTINARVSWSQNDGDRSQDFVYSDTFVNEFLDSYNPTTGRFGDMFTLILGNVEGFDNLKYNAAVVSETGVEIFAE